MTLCICLDDRNGYQFNHRRQSRDAAVAADVQTLGDVYIDAFSQPLFENVPHRIAPESPADLPEHAVFFLENRDPETLLPAASRVVIYRWNRHYPADLRWEPDLPRRGFRLTETLDFPGSSHETITREVYER